jgi:segregation and condensation protein B
MSIKAKLEAIIYAADEPVTLEQIAAVLKDDLQAENTVIEINAPREADKDDKNKVRQDKAQLRALIDELISDYASSDRGMEIREVAGGYRMSTKPEHHDLIRAFAKSLKPPMRLSLQALETLAVIAYKQPITAPEISEIRGVDSSGVLANLLARKLITTAGRKQVIGRPILYKTTKDFLLRFGLKDVSELPSMEEFEKMAGDAQSDLLTGAVGDATGVPDVPDSNTSTAPLEDETHASEQELPHASGNS